MTLCPKQCQTFLRRCFSSYDAMNLSVTNVSVQASVPKKNVLAFNVTQEYTSNEVYLVNFVNDKAKRTGDTVLDTP